MANLLRRLIPLADKKDAELEQRVINISRRIRMHSAGRIYPFVYIESKETSQFLVAGLKRYAQDEKKLYFHHSITSYGFDRFYWLYDLQRGIALVDIKCIFATAAQFERYLSAQSGSGEPPIYAFSHPKEFVEDLLVNLRDYKSAC